MVLTGQDLIASLRHQLIALIVEPLSGKVDDRGGFLQRRIGRDHLARDEIMADAEMLQRPLRLPGPQLIRRDLNDTDLSVSFLMLVISMSRSAPVSSVARRAVH
jgi:hypothetical protein